MGCLILHPMGISPTPVEDPSLLSSPPTKFASASKLRSGVVYRKPQFLTHRWLCAPNPQPRPLRLAASAAGPPDEEEAEEAPVQELRVPEAWLTPSNALQESEWLRVTLHKWLDDEYCPEAANAEISKVAARSYYESLMEQQSDLGEILLKMAKDLETVSFQESFHGAFSSANAAIHLVTLRMNSMARR
ncbi:unnamed protein product [Musa acuminata subsp. burmannicoides]